MRDSYETKWLRPPFLGMLAGLVALNASGVAAQAICSAPHSSPTLAQTGEIGTLAPGSGWIQVSFTGQGRSRVMGRNQGRPAVWRATAPGSARTAGQAATIATGG